MDPGTQRAKYGTTACTLENDFGSRSKKPSFHNKYGGIENSKSVTFLSFYSFCFLFFCSGSILLILELNAVFSSRLSNSIQSIGFSNR